MAEVTPLPALIASCSCQKTQAQGVGFGSAGARNYVWEHRASTSLSREGKNRSCQTELFNTLSCSVLAPHYSETVRSLKYITHYFIPWKMLALQRAHLLKKNKSWFKYLGISYLSHCLRAFVQHWQASHSLTLLFSVVKTWTLWTPIPDFGTRHRVTKVELLSSLTQVSVYIPHDYICDSGKKQMLSLKWDMSSCSTELYSCEFSLLRKAREFHNGLVTHHTKKKIFPWSNRHFTASCWKDLAP